VRMFVAGGTEVLGRPLVEVLVDRRHEVTASTHRTENFSVIEALGARPALMDGLDDAAVRGHQDTDDGGSRSRHPSGCCAERQLHDPAGPKHWCWAHRGSKASSFDTVFSTVKAPRSGRVENGQQGQAVDRGSPGIYNVVGDEPAPQAEWPPYLAEILDALRRGASPRRRPRNSSALKPCTTAPSSARPATPRPSLSWG
jgi:hypothetical protein